MLKSEKGLIPIIVLFILFVLVAVAGGSFYLGQISVQPAASESILTEPIVEPTISPYPKQIITIIKGGEERQKVESFKTFTLNVPPGWQRLDKTDTTGKYISTSFSQDQYSIDFSYQPSGALLCIYPGDPYYGDGKMDTAPLQYPKFSKFREIKTIEGDIFRRGTSNALTHYPSNLIYEDVCQLEKERDIFSTTGYAFIYYIHPQNPDDERLSKMDEILKSVELSQ